MSVQPASEKQVGHAYPHQLGEGFDCDKDKCPAVYWQRHAHVDIQAHTYRTVFPCGPDGDKRRDMGRFNSEMQYHPLKAPTGGTAARLPCGKGKAGAAVPGKA